MIAERTLKRWRRDALKESELTGLAFEKSTLVNLVINELRQRILRLTQELMDLNLMKK